MDILAFFPPWLLLTGLVVYFSFMFTRSNNSSSYNLPPSPPRLPIIGNFHQLISKPFHESLLDLAHKYGPVMLLHLGSKPFLVISSTEMATQALKTHDVELCSRPVSEGPKRLTFDYMDVAFSPHGDHWRDMRKALVSEFLGAKRTRILKKHLEIDVERLVQSLKSSSNAVNLDEVFLNLVNDVVCKVSFGKTYTDRRFNGKTLKEIIEVTIGMLNGSLSDIFPTFGRFGDKLRGWNTRLETSFRDFDGFLQMIINDHIERNNAETKTDDHENDLIDDCLPRLSVVEIKGILMNVLHGAIDTTTVTLVWAMSEIVKNPRVMEKLQNEIRSCVGKNGKVQDSDVAKMTYLKMVVKETLRLHPPPPFLIPRECMSRCQIGGYDVLPGTIVLVNSLAIARDPRTWQKPMEFRPERFENIDVDFGGKHFEMVPFGGGRRACPGYNSATATVEFTIASLLYWFDWKVSGGVKNEELDMAEEGHELIHRKTPLRLVPIKHVWQD